jgi:sortase (surface protein transpeptidase)
MSKAQAILDAIRELNVGDALIIHNEDGSVAYILKLITTEHPENLEAKP